MSDVKGLEASEEVVIGIGRPPTGVLQVEVYVVVGMDEVVGSVLTDNAVGTEGQSLALPLLE